MFNRVQFKNVPSLLGGKKMNPVELHNENTEHNVTQTTDWNKDI